MPPLEQRNWCLPEGLFQANILVLEKYSQRCPTRNLKAEVDFSIIFFFFFLCFEKSLCSSSRRLSRQPAQEGYWDPGHGNRECFRCRLAARPLSSRTSLLLVAQAVGCGPALRASSSSWSIALDSLQEETGL